MSIHFFSNELDLKQNVNTKYPYENKMNPSFLHNITNNQKNLKKTMQTMNCSYEYGQSPRVSISKPQYRSSEPQRDSMDVSVMASKPTEMNCSYEYGQSPRVSISKPQYRSSEPQRDSMDVSVMASKPTEMNCSYEYGQSPRVSISKPQYRSSEPQRDSIDVSVMASKPTEMNCSYEYGQSPKVSNVSECNGLCSNYKDIINRNQVYDFNYSTSNSSIYKDTIMDKYAYKSTSSDKNINAQLIATSLNRMKSTLDELSKIIYNEYISDSSCKEQCNLNTLYDMCTRLDILVMQISQCYLKYKKMDVFPRDLYQDENISFLSKLYDEVSEKARHIIFEVDSIYRTDKNTIKPQSNTSHSSIHKSFHAIPLPLNTEHPCEDYSGTSPYVIKALETITNSLVSISKRMKEQENNMSILLNTRFKDNTCPIKINNTIPYSEESKQIFKNPLCSPLELSNNNQQTSVLNRLEHCTNQIDSSNTSKDTVNRDINLMQTNEQSSNASVIRAEKYILHNQSISNNELTNIPDNLSQKLSILNMPTNNSGSDAIKENDKKDILSAYLSSNVSSNVNPLRYKTSEQNNDHKIIQNDFLGSKQKDLVDKSSALRMEPLYGVHTSENISVSRILNFTTKEDISPANEIKKEENYRDNSQILKEYENSKLYPLINKHNQMSMSLAKSTVCEAMWNTDTTTCNPLDQPHMILTIEKEPVQTYQKMSVSDKSANMVLLKNKVIRKLAESVECWNNSPYDHPYYISTQST